MSTFYATFADHQRAKDALRELLRGGVRPDDASLLLPGTSVADTQDLTAGNSVGDATYFVGRDDDPPRDIPSGEGGQIGNVNAAFAGNMMGIDTSDKGKNVEMLDQMDDSQSEAEGGMLHPPLGITQSEHEKDDIALTVLTGFPTDIPTIEPLPVGDFEMQDQNEEALEALDVPGFGAVLGNGALATAALGDGDVDHRLTGFFEDDGVPTAAIDDLLGALRDGQALLAIVATPGEIDEPTVEAIAERQGGINRGLFDAPRFYDNDAYTVK
ncbi:hypothetical protein EON82_00440 [bacterium]|nr:MAG: hypothetical protein EON82_00440 [bacterium]